MRAIDRPPVDALHRKPAANSILELIPKEHQQQLLRSSDLVTVKIREVIAKRNEENAFVYFPTTAVFSMMTLMSSGEIVEVGTIGSEGIVGVQLVLGERIAFHEIYCQIPGDAVRMSADNFLAIVAASTRLRHLCEQYISGLIDFLAQSVACNGLHTVTERCAKWLLMTHDRVRRDDFQLTHEFLAMMLGVRRPGVSVAASALQHAGYIEYKRGHVFIHDRNGLQDAACECYDVTKTAFQRALRDRDVRAVSA